MSSGLVLSFIILAVAAASLWYILQAEGGVTLLPELLERVGVPVPKISIPPIPTPRAAPAVPYDFTSGSSRFSQGSCRADNDCQISGCSAEVCGNGPTITTCEYSDSFPSATKYSCGCTKGICGWRQK